MSTYQDKKCNTSPKIKGSKGFWGKLKKTDITEACYELQCRNLTSGKCLKPGTRAYNQLKKSGERCAVGNNVKNKGAWISNWTKGAKEFFKNNVEFRPDDTSGGSKTRREFYEAYKDNKTEQVWKGPNDDWPKEQKISVWKKRWHDAAALV